MWAREIHALMQDADDIDVVGDDAVKQDVRAAGNFVVARAYIRAVPHERDTIVQLRVNACLFDRGQ
jgi:hypothetical protein